MAIQLFATEANLATVRRLSVRSAIGDSARRELDGGTRRVWNQIAYEGEWLGHSAGEFEFTREVFETVIANFERRDDPLPLTYGHPDSETASYMGAAGWIHALRISSDDQGRIGLFAEMEFTDRAAGQVKAGEQRHCSVVLSFDSIDEKTGEPIGAELYEVGLVLSAFVDGMRPLAASGRNRKTPAHGGTNTPTPTRSLAMNAKELLTKVTEELPKDATYEQMLKLLDAEHAKMQALEGDEDPKPEPPAEAAAASQGEGEGDTPVEAAAEPPAAPEVEAAADGMHSPGVEAIVAEVVAQGGDVDAVAIDAFLAEAAKEIAALYAGAPADGGAADESAMSAAKLENKALSREVAKLSAQVKELTDARDAAETAALEAKVDEAIELGAFEAGERDELVSLGRSAPKQLDSLIAKMSAATPPPGVPRSRQHRPAPPSESKRVRLSKREEIASLTSRESHFYESQVALGKAHDEAITAARKLSKERAAVN